MRYLRFLITSLWLGAPLFSTYGNNQESSRPIKASPLVRSCQVVTAQLPTSQIKFEPISIEGGLPEIPFEREMVRNLSDQFQHFTLERRALGIQGVIQGEIEYRAARKRAGLSILPVSAFEKLENRPHPYWDIGVQAFVVSAWMADQNKIAATSAAMAYLLHDIDDVADRHLTMFLDNTSPEEFQKPTLDFLEEHFPAGYSKLYSDLLAMVERAIPRFDRKGFDEATMRMIQGSVLLSENVQRARREKFQSANKQRHLLMLSDKTDSKDAAIRKFLDDEVSNVYYAYTVKSLPDGIFSFYDQGDIPFDKALMILFGIVTAPGLVLENLVKEKERGEFTYDGVVTDKEVIRICERAAHLLSSGVAKGHFDLDQIYAFRDAFVAYGDAFRIVLTAAGLYDTTYEHVLHELDTGITILTR